MLKFVFIKNFGLIYSRAVAGAGSGAAEAASKFITGAGAA
jgi:hypothetical protein